MAAIGAGMSNWALAESFGATAAVVEVVVVVAARVSQRAMRLCPFDRTRVSLVLWPHEKKGCLQRAQCTCPRTCCGAPARVTRSSF